MITWITGQRGSGKSTLAKRMRKNEVWLDGDMVREIWPGLTLSEEDRRENNLRTARLAKELEDQGFDVIVSTICPYKDLRDQVRQITKCKFVYLDGGKEGADCPYEFPT